MRHGGGVERFGIGAISKLNSKIKRSVHKVDGKRSKKLGVEGGMEESGGVSIWPVLF